ncbi:hypothetical protein [Roseomonas chloroacetimidivorans]|uniref:hypothetical protein n=1 Tax=Roseomonas chloroacetimidivorans TaxID=1766656 RepID=UPI003C77105D
MAQAEQAESSHRARSCDGGERGRCAVHVRRAGARFDLLLTDDAIPGMNGVDLVDAIRAVQPGLVLLFTTGYSASPVLHSERE